MRKALDPEWFQVCGALKTGHPVVSSREHVGFEIAWRLYGVGLGSVGFNVILLPS